LERKRRRLLDSRFEELESVLPHQRGVYALFYLIDLLAVLRGRFRLAYHSLIVAGSLSIFASVSFSYYFVSDNFALKAVYEHSSRSLPPLLKLSASWTGPGGSLLLWL